MNSKRKMHYYDSATDDRRARITDVPGLGKYRLVIRSDRGQGPVTHERVYNSHRGARNALNRRGSWSCCKRTTY